MRSFHTVVLAASLLCAGCAQIAGVIPVRTTGADALADNVTISRDAYGVPHIFGDTDAAVAFGIGYAQAEDRFEILEEQYLHALGRASHWYGERYLASDLVQAAFEVERLAREEYEREPASRRAIWDAFADGINFFIGTSGIRPRLLTRFEPWMPFALARTIAAGTVVDGVRLGVAYDSAAGAHLVGEWLGATYVAGYGGDAHVEAGAVQSGAGPRLSAGTLLAASLATGHTLLLHSETGPYESAGLPWEHMLHSDEGWHVRGHSPLGSPVPVAGHNGAIAWAHASSGIDAADVFRVRFDHPSDPLMYRFDDGWRSAVQWQDTLLVNTPAGVQERVFTFRRTHHGPVVATQGDTALAVRFARMTDGGSLQQLLAESRATSLDAFRAALDQRAVAAHVMYADTAGTVYRLLGATVPARDTTLDWTAPVDGGSSSSDWTEYLPLSALPETVTSARGVLHAGRASATEGRLLEADSLWTVASWSSIAFDSRLADAEDRITSLIAEWEQVGGRNAARARRLDDAVELMRSWDYVADTTSVEATLFILWQDRLRESAYTGEYAQFRALEDVVSWLEEHHGSSRVPWGDVNRLQRPEGGLNSAERTSVGVGGAPAWAGSMFVVEGGTGIGESIRFATGGTRLVSVVELGGGVRMRTIVPFGQAGDPASAHWSDQTSLFTAGGLKDALFTRAEVEAAAVETYRPGRR